MLRAFAAVSVVFFHTHFSFPFTRSFGSFGVDVFFVISGYIMARILDPNSGARSDFFLRRRILRIVPPYWFFTLVLFIVAFLNPKLMGATRADGLELLKSLLFIPFAKSNGLVEPLLFVGWSLNYEMFFYLALAVGLLISKRNAAWIGSAIVLGAMLFCMPFAQSGAFTHFYASGFMAEFILGVISYYISRAIPNRTAQRLRLPCVFICIACALLLIATQAILPKVDISRVFILGALSFLLVTTASMLSLSGRDIRLSWLVLIGDASYVLYLIHPYCENSLDRLLGQRIHWLRVNTACGALVAISLSIFIAVVIHVYGELPTVQFLNSRFGGKRSTVEFSGQA